MKKDLPRIYLDMDGVLCDFSAQIVKATGKSKAAWLKIPTSRKWDTLRSKIDQMLNGTAPI